MRFEKICIKRRGQEDLIDGHWLKGQLIEFKDIEANIQPLKGTEVLQLAEGDRKKRTRKMFTPSFEIETNDIIEHENIKYEVQVLEVWKGIKLNYSKCVLVKLEDQGAEI